MSWISYIFPRTLLKTATSHNYDIRVVEEHGRLKLLVNGSRQSGAYVEQLWLHAIKSFHLYELFSVRTILVLGVGGGTVIHMMHRMYKDASMIGVDIDAQILKIGKIYFKLRSIPSLRLIQADAREYVAAQAKEHHRFDLVVVDLFIGRDIPEFVTSRSFLIYLKRLLGRRGMLVLNYLREEGYGEKSKQLHAVFASLFGDVKTSDVYRNRFFFAVR